MSLIMGVISKFCFDTRAVWYKIPATAWFESLLFVQFSLSQLYVCLNHTKQLSVHKKFISKLCQGHRKHCRGHNLVCDDHLRKWWPTTWIVPPSHSYLKIIPTRFHVIYSRPNFTGLIGRKPGSQTWMRIRERVLHLSQADREPILL